MDASISGLRRKAFERLAALGTVDAQETSSKPSISRLINECRSKSSYPAGLKDGLPHGLARPPMALRELEVILALTKTSPTVTRHDQAQSLASQFAEYLTTSYCQKFKPSPFLHDIKPSPWEALTHELTRGLLELASRDASIRHDATDAIMAYLSKCARFAEHMIEASFDQSEHERNIEPVDILSTVLSIVGFLEGASYFTELWNPTEKLAIVKLLERILTVNFLVAVETAASQIRNSSAPDSTSRNWKRYHRRYTARRRPLGAMLLQQCFARFTRACTNTTVLNSAVLDDTLLLKKYADGEFPAKTFHTPEVDILVKHIVGVTADKVQLLEDGADYLQIGSQWQQDLAFSVKASCLVSFLNCVYLNGELADPELLLAWLEDILSDENQMAALQLATTTLRVLAGIARLSPANAASLSHLLLDFIRGGSANHSVIAVAASHLANILDILSQDFVITTLYSLGNALSPTAVGADRSVQLPANLENSSSTDAYHSNADSVISLSYHGEDDPAETHRSVIHTIVTIAFSCKDENIAALAQSMLLQKIGRISVSADACIVREIATLALVSKHADFQLLLKFYARIHQEALLRGQSIIVDAVDDARNQLSIALRHSPSHKATYLVHLLESIISKGDVSDLGNDRHKEVTLFPEDITPYLKPLALLLSVNEDHEEESTESTAYDEATAALFRDAWFNIAVHEISIHSDIGHRYRNELCAIAKKSPPLVPENRSEILESDVELNIILRRGMGHHRLAEQRKILMHELPEHESSLKRISYQETIFLNASLLIESVRASAGDCTRIILYFLDPTLSSSELGRCMKAVVDKVIDTYLLKTLSGVGERFASPRLSKQLAEIFIAGCHRIHRVQDVALDCASRIINRSPPVLCARSSLFVLLDLLTIMWSSCFENDLDEFGWKSTLTKGGVTVELSDNHESRQRTLDSFYTRAKAWMVVAINLAPLDVKGLLQTYLSEHHEDDGSYGHIALGQSFALEMASRIPQSDQRLSLIENYGVNGVNCASELVAQYSTRQEYRYSEFSQTNGGRKDTEQMNGTADSYLIRYIEVIENLLKQLSLRVSAGYDLPSLELHDALRKAAALLCRSDDDLPSIVHYLVNIPFQIFTKDSIKFGVSIWLGVINENPRTESRILVEVASAWESTTLSRKGVFNPAFNHPDPFYTAIELLPSDKAALLRKQQRAQDILSPHLRILQFFESHFNAIRLASPHLQRIFTRAISRTLIALQHTHGHPLSREVHFHIVLLGLRILQYSTTQSRTFKWKLKDLILSAALSWFRHPPRWSFGGNRLQQKAEDKVLQDIEDALQLTAMLSSADKGPHRSLRNKQELLQHLIQNERMRLRVWLYPLEHEKKHYMTGISGKSQSEAFYDQLLRTAWTENASLAIQICSRFPSQKIHQDVRRLLLNSPEKAMEVSGSLEIMFGSCLPTDVTHQLKYLLYWAPVAPTEALTYFLPAFGNHPFVLQYAMRALESHSMDVRFYFIPQLVQALRYDALGYVERYIYESAKLSQLFSHQVIWNMKANAYKDENSEIPDAIKPTLDNFMDRLITSFSGEERAFYEREFSFFSEVTDISGKLRPYIKKSKPEKKQKIEEELRKIKVEVGVYLPSNPDGIVVGIDRKSGKPLQSHAKAPYMATFRIQKTKALEAPATAGKAQSEIEESRETETYEVWQSAIFKVGDDCRQDLLALQLIAAFRNVFNSVGLDVWVFPYRVTATAPGCGMIDVLPNSISRDMLGREAVNGLYDYFVSKYGGEESLRFQEARTNFVKSMASYSVISYLLQFKDRHNGNIMIDDAGHIIHIDFGFCFDIAPGGVRFERAPFKLTSEMVAVMGGGPNLTGSSSNGSITSGIPSGGSSHSSTNGSTSSQSGTSSLRLPIPGTHSHEPTTTQPYQWFESLTVKAFLASRPHATKFIQIVTMMLDSGLPCFKPDTIKNFRDRFVLDKTEREAADYMRELTRKSYLNLSTRGYDQFQLMTNGIPY